MKRKGLSVRGARPWQRKGGHGGRWRLRLGPLRQLRRADSPRRKRVPSYHRPRSGSCEQSILRHAILASPFKYLQRNGLAEVPP